MPHRRAALQLVHLVIDSVWLDALNNTAPPLVGVAASLAWFHFPSHPTASRKAKQNISKKHHEAKFQRRKKVRKSKDNLKRAKLLWFKEHIPRDKDKLSIEELRQLIVRYLERFKLESKAEEKEVANCSVSVTIDMANEYVKQESQEFLTTGLSVPDLTSKPNFEKFVQWNGEMNKMISIPMIVVRKSYF
ncbi:hypothetical protein ACTXT7_006202 [Hymenolepis weldensis]